MGGVEFFWAAVAYLLEGLHVFDFRGNDTEGARFLPVDHGSSRTGKGLLQSVHYLYFFQHLMLSSLDKTC
jgi:hypothetical protein